MRAEILRKQKEKQIIIAGSSRECAGFSKHHIYGHLLCASRPSTCWCGVNQQESWSRLYELHIADKRAPNCINVCKKVNQSTIACKAE